MGTNYELYYNKCSKCKRSDSVHIGKSSAGWKFLFQKIPDLADTPMKWRELTSKGEIIDEYGHKCSYKKFWQLIESKQTEPRFQGEIIDGYDFLEGSDWS